MEITVEELKSLIPEDFSGAIGLRGLYSNEQMGTLENSYVWIDGEMTDEKLNGTCALEVSANWEYDNENYIIKNLKYALESINEYGNGRVGVVIGDYEERGNDKNEIIISNAQLIKIYEI